MKNRQNLIQPTLLMRSEWLCILKKRALKWLALSMVLAMFNLTIGCNSFFKVKSSKRPPSETITQLNNAKKTIIVHFDEMKWLLTDVKVENDTVKGMLNEYKKAPTFKPVKPDKPNRYLTRATNNQRYLLNEVHLYLDEMIEPTNNRVLIPVSAINKVDIYDPDTAATVGSYFISGLGITAGTILVLAVIIALTKESCPFIYTWDGEKYDFAGEIYSGSIHQPLERNDYLKLPVYPGQKQYTLKITNEVREIQHTNLLELLVIDHPGNTIVLADKYGKIQTLAKPLEPTLTTSLKGENVTELVASKDPLFYQSQSKSKDLPLKDGLILQFPSQGDAKSAKLAIHAKNSILLDYMLGQFQDLLGAAYASYMKKQNMASADQMRQWSLDQGIPLSVYVERNNSWEFVDYYNVAGPMKFKDDVISVPLNGNETNPLKIKLEFGNYLWEIDCATIDYSSPVKVKSYIVSVSTAITEDQTEVTGALSKDDRSYYSQPTMSNQAVVTFDLPEPTDQQRTVILHSKGWYEILRNPEGKPDIKKLRAFKNPGHFNQFINERLSNKEQTVSKSSLQ
ncbi:MAG TPA: hypothetical protein VGK10_11630 [Prolixibacteraceae bacterium]|jgi:hypothetical protein